jgi:hypothetical protein
MNTTHTNTAIKALEMLYLSTQLKGTWMPIVKTKPNNDLDGLIKLGIGGKTYKLGVKVKNNIRTIHLPQLYELAQQNPQLIILADQIFPKIKEALRNHNIAYLETNGNVWLKHDKGLYWIDANKTHPEEKVKVNRAFTKTGLKVVFDIIRDEALVNVPYRELAARAEIALGNINYIMNGLKEMGFLLKLKKDTYKLTNKRELLNTWITKYEEKLKPDLEIGTFRFLKDEDFIGWKTLPVSIGETYWGGEPGGELYTNYLKPAVLTLYTTEERNDLIKNYRLIPDPKGDVKIYKKFWKQDEVNTNAAPPLLVYADLMNTGDDRCIETANKIYGEFLQDK